MAVYCPDWIFLRCVWNLIEKQILRKFHYLAFYTWTENLSETGAWTGMAKFEMPEPGPGLTLIISFLKNGLVCAYFFRFLWD